MFISTNRSNPCPICTDTNGKFRSKDTLFTLPDQSTIDDRQFLCMAVRENNNGYKFTGETSDRLNEQIVNIEIEKEESYRTHLRSS